MSYSTGKDFTLSNKIGTIPNAEAGEILEALYRVDGDDTGVQDITALIQAKINAGGIATLSDGTYRISGSLTFPASGSKFILRPMAGANVTLIRSDASVRMFDLDNTANATDATTVSSITEATSTGGSREHDIVVADAPDEAIRHAYAVIYGDYPNTAAVGDSTDEETLNNAITTNGTTTITIACTAHGREAGAWIYVVSQETAVDGITLGGAYKIASVPTADSFTITVGGAASGSTSGAGGALLLHFCGGYIGEAFQIAEVSGNTISSFGLLKRPTQLSAASAAYLRVLDDTRYVEIGDFTIIEDENNFDTNITTREEIIHIQGFVGGKIGDITIKDPMAQGLWIQCCADFQIGKIRNIHGYNKPSVNSYTYGMYLYGMCYNIRIDEVLAEQGRHGITNGANTKADPFDTAKWLHYGLQTSCRIKRISGQNVTGTLGDWHEQGDGFIIDEIVLHNATSSQDAAIMGGAGHQERSRNTTIGRIIVDGGLRGLKFTRALHDLSNRLIVGEMIIRNLKSSNDTDDIGLEVEDMTRVRSGYTQEVIINKLICDNLGTATAIGAMSNVTIHEVAFKDVDVAYNQYAGSILKVTGSHHYDFQNATHGNPNYISRMRSSSTAGGCTALFFEPASLIKGGSSNRPAAFFDEVDTTASKTYFLPDIIEYNPSGVARTRLLEAGATTLVEASNITRHTSQSIAKDIPISSAQLLALNATPVQLLPAPGSNKAIIFEGAMLFYDYNSAAYAGIDANDDLMFRYTNGSGAIVGACEATGFLDQTADRIRYVYPSNGVDNSMAAITPVANAALVLHMANGEITTGNSPLGVRVFYKIVDYSTLLST